MPVPDLTVTARFTVTDGVFIIGDPVWGVIGGPGVIGGDIPVDITDYLDSRQTITVTRGRRNFLSDFDPGTTTIPLEDNARAFDSLHTGSPFAGNIVPGKKFALAVEGVTIYTGSAITFANDYRRNAASTVSIPLEDSLARLARVEMDAWTPTAGQLPGARIADVLDRPEVGFGANRLLDDGRNTLPGAPIEQGTRAGDYLKLVARSDLGRVFADRSNRVMFRDRTVSVTPVLTFTDDGTGAADIEQLRRSDTAATLYTRVSVQRVGGVVQVSENTAASTLFEGTRSLPITGLLLETDDQAAAMCSYLVNILSTPEQRIESITFTPSLVADAGVRAAMYALEFGDVIRVLWTPLEIGDPIDRLCVVEAIEHVISPTRHDMRLGLSDVANRTPFIIGDPVYGVIGGPGRIAY